MITLVYPNQGAQSSPDFYRAGEAKNPPGAAAGRLPEGCGGYFFFLFFSKKSFTGVGAGEPSPMASA